MSEDDGKLKNIFFSSIGSEFNKCLDKSMSCDSKAIKAHSVQNSNVLDLLSEDGHVIQIKLKVSGDKPPEPEYKLVGRNRATTFTGLCAEHDSSIFKEIDTEELNVDSARQLYLLAYRSVLRELHATMHSAGMIQGAYQKIVEMGLDPKDQPSSAGLEAVFQMIKSWRTFRYRCKYDRLEESDCYEDLIHFTKSIDTTEATVAASVLFGVGKYSNEEDLVGVALNIVPLNASKTVIVFSYFKEDEQEIKKEFPELYEAEGHYLAYVVSKLLLGYGENLVVLPSFYNNWSDEKRACILEYFTKTMLEEEHEKDNEHLFLFKM
jgi:hypothetical protein